MSDQKDKISQKLSDITQQIKVAEEEVEEALQERISNATDAGKRVEDKIATWQQKHRALYNFLVVVVLLSVLAFIVALCIQYYS